jgi:hypothetical protein
MLIVARPLPIVQQPTLATVSSMPSIGKVSTMLEASGGLCYYARPICKIVSPQNIPDGVDIKIFLDQEGVDAVAVAPALFDVPSLANNPTFGSFVETATKNGWIRHDLPAPEGQSYLYILARPSPSGRIASRRDSAPSARSEGTGDWRRSGSTARGRAGRRFDQDTDPLELSAIGN